MPRGEWVRSNIKTRCEQVNQLNIQNLSVINWCGEVEVFVGDVIQVHYFVDDDWIRIRNPSFYFTSALEIFDGWNNFHA